jgi:hypothetical protein
MKRPNKGGKRTVPQPGGESFQMGVAGPPTYHMRFGPPKSRIRYVDGQLVAEPLPPMTPQEWEAHCEREGILFSDRPLVPTAEEIAKLPRNARTAFARRCAARVARLLGSDAPAELDPQTAAQLLLARAAVETPLARQLRCIRRDFDQLVHLARKNNWTDDTAVPPSVFGPMWPRGLAPAWAAEPPGAS